MIRHRQLQSSGSVFLRSYKEKNPEGKRRADLGCISVRKWTLNIEYWVSIDFQRVVCYKMKYKVHFLI